MNDWPYLEIIGFLAPIIFTGYVSKALFEKFAVFEENYFGHFMSICIASFICVSIFLLFDFLEIDGYFVIWYDWGFFKKLIVLIIVVFAFKILFEFSDKFNSRAS